ncbi:hypothetical protein F406_gp062 [Agrobacterium phage 7-7-1]|uniref:Uncharacterized protein n=1 Tax=Agrobacterium phage 7-7-1 TaxID=1161931 RepID=J7FAR1_9CAUD|nr:hypothetical protein F406_gp062 [Agrobacterium phage 7-7-1]AFH19753.1 hypothetical protein 7-7-1_00055 [Agrobacterium phage 7-7-1]
MITIQLTEAEAARIFYALSAEAVEHHSKMRHEIKNGALSAASGRLQIIHETALDECMAVVRKIEDASR